MPNSDNRGRILLGGSGLLNDYAASAMEEAGYEPIRYVVSNKPVGGFHYIPNRFTVQKSVPDYKEFFIRELTALMERECVDIIFPGLHSSTHMQLVYTIGRKLGLAVPEPDVVELLIDKGKLYSHLRNHNYSPLPKEYVSFSSCDLPSGKLKFPCVFKPDMGSGGEGVFVAHCQSEAEWFLGPTHDSLNERKEFLTDRLADGSPRNYMFCSFGGGYRVEEYIQGTVISVSGFSINGVHMNDHWYEITMGGKFGTTEVGWHWPPTHRGVEIDVSLINRQVEILFDCLPAYSGPYTMDFIYTDDGEFVLIDFAPRIGGSTMIMYYHAGRLSQLLVNEIECLRATVLFPPCLIGDPISIRTLDIPKGTLKELVIPDGIETVSIPSPGTEFMENRSDLEARMRGMIFASGENARQKIESATNNIRVIME